MEGIISYDVQAVIIYTSGWSRGPLVVTMSSSGKDANQATGGGGLQVTPGGGTSDHLSPEAGFNVYETKYQRSLRNYLTREKLPNEAHYRNLNSVMDGSGRPTMEDLHNATFHEQEVG